MILVVIGVALFVSGVFFWGDWLESKIGYPLDTLAQTIIAFVGLLICCIGVIVPIHGYEEPVVVEEYALEEIIEDTGVYIIESNDGAITYKYILKENDDSRLGYNERYRIVIDATSKPIMKKTLKKTKKSPLTFALGCDITEYVFYVPKNGIIKG